ncbi:MAG TPA: heparinase II/III family protein [Hymenobacter sp.]|uniref:heparinase II/III domain-containing protein n=1 Tax=Hymenobacter sp. TaxID=1898978 RepID=UPI002D7FCFFA|nr:heparinase II/III family protein [Hymenobacter sp.]HET9503996.1 heparinase II/III family protein [Hymenobacter sp.]
MNKLVVILLALCGAGQLRAQSGAWLPDSARPAYPRTLLAAPALPQVQASLAEPGRRAIYQSLWADVQSPPPTDNTSASGRRARATWAKNAAFAVLLNRQPAGAGLAPLPAETHDALAASARSLLESLNTEVEPFATWTGTMPYTEWQWRSKELIDYLIAYDLLRGAGESAAALAAGQARLQVFAGNLYRQSTTPLMGITFYSAVKNNHTLMTAAALGMAAVVLNDATSTDANQQPARWAGAGLHTIDNVLWRDAQRQSDSTQVAGYAEGPYYCKYALLNCLPYFRAMGNFLPDGRLPYTFGGSTRSIRNPYFDPKYDRLYEWLTAIRLPDGRLPALEDSYVDMGMPELALTGKPQYAKPMYYSKITGTGMASDLAQLRDATVDMRAAWLAAAVAPTAPAHPALTVLPGSGNLIFRSGADSAATYLHVYGRGGTAQSNSGGHNQGDASSFILHAQGQLLALDPGYLSYGRRAEVGAATSHNLVLVDGAGPALGAPGATNSAPAAIERTFQTPQLSYGEVTTSYQQARLTRKTLFVRNTYYLLADAVSAAAPRTYTWQLHGYGLAGGTAATGTFAGNLAGHEGTWQKNGVRLLAHVAGTGTAATYATATNPHETTYNTAENHTTLLVQQSGTTQTQFLSALYPYAAQPPQVATTSQATTAALATAAEGFVDVAFAQADTVLTADASGRLPQAVQADGLLNFYSADANGKFAQLFVQAGTTLQVGPAAVLTSARRADISWQRLSPGHYAGYASRATTLLLALGSAPSAVRGAGVASYAYDAGLQQLRVVLSQASDFEVALPAAGSGTAPLPVVLTDFAGQRQSAAVALSWHTASEQHNAGFEVQRRTAEAADFTTLGFVVGAGTASRNTGYAFRDAAAPAGLVYYRLRQLDRDSTATYSPVVAVAGTTPAGAAEASMRVFPQPARDWLRVQMAGSAPPTTLQLLDNLGRVVRQQLCQTETQLDVRGLPAGLYYLVASGTAGRQKVVIEP